MLERFVIYLEHLSVMQPVQYGSKDLDAFIRIQWKVINKHLIGSGLIREAATLPPQAGRN